jgi:hypothetical protein
MGNYFTVNMEENFKRNQDFITEMNTIKVRLITKVSSILFKTPGF